MKALIIGCGSIGRRHALSASQLGWSFALVDSEPGRADAVARECGADASFADLDRGLDWAPEAVIVATPHIHHLEHAARAAKAGAHVLIEKPLSHSLDGLPEALDMFVRTGTKAYVVSNMRFHPAVRAVGAALPRIGRVLYARSYYGDYLPSFRPGRDYRELYCSRKESGGGVVLDGAIHEIDLVMHMFGPVKRVQADAAHLSSLEIDVEDFATMVLEHETGVRSLITFDYFRRWARRGMEVIGEDGQIEWTSEGKAPEYCKVRVFDAGAGEWETLFDCPDLDDTPMYAELLAAFANAVEGKGVALQTVPDAVERLKVALAARDGQTNTLMN